jgi:predicted ATPase
MRWRAACILQCCGEVRRVEEDTGALVRFCEDEGVVPWLSGAAILQGWARAKGGQGNEGIALMRQGLREWRASGTELMCPYYLGLLAEACADAGRAEEGRRAVLEALAVVAATGERWYESELHRRLGLLTIEGGAKPSEGEAHLREALAMARRQGAKSLELRAAASLARLTGRPRRAEARHALAEVLAWFPEGLDSADVGEARDVLENLA